MFEGRQLRKEFLSPAMLGEPAFDLLLALYVPGSSGMISVHVLSSLINVRVSVAVRWLRFLAKEGLVLIIEADNLRAISATLTEKGRIALDEYFRAAGDRN